MPYQCGLLAGLEPYEVARARRSKIAYRLSVRKRTNRTYAQGRYKTWMVLRRTVHPVGNKPLPKAGTPNQGAPV